MSTPAIVNFCDKDENIQASIYVHWDGYPDDEDGMFHQLNNFFENVSQLTDTRFKDPSYLAAKFIVHLMDGDIGSLGCGVVSNPNKFQCVNYFYTVICKDNTKPKVICSTTQTESPHNEVKQQKIVRFDYNSRSEVKNRLVVVSDENNIYLEGTDLNINEFRKFLKTKMKNIKEVTI